MDLKAVIFDLGGTLIDYPSMHLLKEVCQDNWRQIASAYPDALMRMYEINQEKLKIALQTQREITFAECFNQALKEQGLFLEAQARQAILEKLYFFSIREQARLCRGAKELLEEIKNQGLKIGLVSNVGFAGYLHEQDLKKFGLFPYFQTIVWSSDFGLRKPHPAIFYRALVGLRVAQSQTIYIGDRLDQDAQGANKAGMKAILISQEERKENFDGWQVKELKQVFEVIQGSY